MSNLNERAQFVSEWTIYDLLQLKNKTDFDFLGFILGKFHTNKLEVLKWVELFSGFPDGRSYLLDTPNALRVVEKLVETYQQEKLDSNVQQAVLLVLQRLSLR